MPGEPDPETETSPGAPDHEPPAALAGVKVVEIGGALTNYCGKLLAELGADVILVEPPAGSELRHQPPYADDVPDLEASLPFFYQNTSKRGIVVDLHGPGGQRVIKRLAASADVVLDGLPPGTLGQRGLGADDLIADNPRLVVASITPFGQSGPYAHYAHADLVCLAFGGMLWLGGYADGQPVQAVGEQAYMAGNAFGAVGSMIALTHAELTGVGQHVDVSVQEAVALGLENSAQYYDLERRVRRRFGGTQRDAGFGVFPCADGHVVVLANGVGGHRFWGNLIAWMTNESVPGVEALAGEQWSDRAYLATAEAKDVFSHVFTALSLRRTKKELYEASQKWRVPLGPVNLPSEVAESKQLDSRGYFVDAQAFGRWFRMPGAPYRLSETPWRMSRPAPRLGEHTREVLREHGFAHPEIDALAGSRGPQ